MTNPHKSAAIISANLRETSVQICVKHQCKSAGNISANLRETSTQSSATIISKSISENLRETV
jgi:hypothetical protein